MKVTISIDPGDGALYERSVKAKALASALRVAADDLASPNKDLKGHGPRVWGFSRYVGDVEIDLHVETVARVVNMKPDLTGGK